MQPMHSGAVRRLQLDSLSIMSEERGWIRANLDSIIDAYTHLFRSSTPIAKLKDASFSGRLFPISAIPDEVPLGVAGRSLAWKLFLIPNAPLSLPAHQTPARPPLNALDNLRKEYAALLTEKMRAPDGSYEEGFTVPGCSELPRPSEDETANLQRNNPLSLHEDNPWKEWFSAVDLRKTIRQDVERTFPDYDYFRDPDVQAQLTQILYIHSVMHPDIGYRQGMHELLAPIFFALDFDSLTPDQALDTEITTFCSRTWLAADAWALFGVVMEGVNTWYEWREPSPPPLPPSLKAQYRHAAPEGQVELKPYVAPIVLACQTLQAQMLKSTDPALWQGMQKAGIEPQIYGIRWLRLLFTREFSLPDAMLLWDGIFSFEESFELVPWICVSMLIRIRNKLIASDYSGQLTSLLRYPPPPEDIDSTSPLHSVLLLRQAFALRTAPTPQTGSSIAIENRNLLNIPLDSPEPVTSPVITRRPNRPPMRNRASTEGQRTGSSGDLRGTRKATQQSQQVSLGELFAKGLLERGEALGINKTVMNAVSELRKNIPELANQLIRTPGTGTNSYSSFPLVDDRPSDERPPWDHRSRLEMEGEIAQLRSFQRQLGDAVALSVDALLQDEGNDRPAEILQRIKERKREALESLAHVRDLLKGNAKEVDDERLYGEEEYRRRRKPLPARHFSPPPRLPEPAAATRSSIEHRRQQSSPPAQNAAIHPLISLPRTPAVPLAIKTDVGGQVKPGQSATLPRRSSVSTTPAAEHPDTSDLAQAPWNYTRSNFGAPALGTPGLQRPPPPSRPTLQLPPASRQRKPSSDPLGALSP